jgi:hypothetical protein
MCLKNNTFSDKLTLLPQHNNGQPSLCQARNSQDGATASPRQGCTQQG